MRVKARVVTSALVVLIAANCAREASVSSPDASRTTGTPAAAPVAAEASESVTATTTGASLWAPPTTTAPAPPVPVIDPLGKPPAAGSASNGAAIYAAKCASCHGMEARADTAMAKKYGLLDFRSANVRALTSSDLAQIMKAGRGTISEEAHPETKLSESDVRDMIAFIKSLK
ncbi:MAG: cytochrome c [Thermoanaerobaculia bacterium]|jgi:mono/diheme cytochrome c family protein